MGNLQLDNQPDVLDIPPQIPPRLKKKLGGPPLPEKPLHIRAKQIPSSHQNSPREPLKLRNPDGREILVAGPKERPIEKRQREPAKLLAPTNLHSSKSRQRDCDIVPIKSATYQKNRRPVLLIPRNLMNSWGPVTYALWAQREHMTTVRNHSPETSGTSVVRSGSSVTRSGSLTSQGSSGSDSGDETFPKSVLKKHHHKADDPPKKIVTFNAFATVQLVDE